MFTLDDQTFYEIENVATNTSLTLVKAFRGATASGQSYGIPRNYSIHLAADALAQLTEASRKYNKYIDADLTHIKGERGDPGVLYKNAWAASQTYNALDVVMHNNKLYVAKINHVSVAANAPGTTGSLWQEFALTVPPGVDIFNYNSSGLHNSSFRGKNLGSSFTAAQSAAIKAGTFDDLWIGDYWDVQNLAYTYLDTSGNTQSATYTGKLRIADFDYFYSKGDQGDNGCVAHHIIVVPDMAMFTRQMNATATTEGGYAGSDFYTKPDGLARARAIFKAFFGADHLVTHREFLCNGMQNGKPYGVAWYNSDVDLMSEPMVIGSYINASGDPDGNTIMVNRNTASNSQLNLFRLDPKMICNHTWFWLRELFNGSCFAMIHFYGHTNIASANDGRGIRPYGAVN